jgi:3-deoxy-manno-octulosonate cytidylyltransferase (CMP-KDO synthetase)
MNFIGIIPARYASSRFPGKPLCDILGQPMIKRVYDSVMKWPQWDKVYVATESYEIVNACESWEIPCLMTGDHHVDCLDRAAEAAQILEDRGEGADRYITIQGDEPLFETKTLNTDLAPEIVNFYTETVDENDLYDANAVKVVVSYAQRALYFSRYTVPYHDMKTRRDDAIALIVYKQIGVYSFSYEKLCLYTSLPLGYLERIEGIGLLRLLENDIDVHMRHTEYDSISVDTPTDRLRIIEMISKKAEGKIIGLKTP